MIFHEVFGNQKINENDVKINYREAVRAVIIQENKILLIQSNKGDYKFPGGGVEKNESHVEGLLREVTEETGYINCIVKDKIGVVIQKHIDEYDNSSFFQMTSHYYICELINHERVSLQLDDYEVVQEYKPKWVTLDDAIYQNEKVINQFEKNRWIKRENFVLKELTKFYERIQV
jgi:8-oxo-dGTP pyrophosphatase MutT (NUDIX family)